MRPLDCFARGVLPSLRNRNEFDDYGDGVLHAAVARKDWDAKSNDILLTLLQDDRVDVNHANEECASLLLSTPCFSGSYRQLPSTFSKNTPFHYFCQKYTGPHVVGLLDRFCERGADVHAKNRYGETVLHKAMFNPSLKMTLVDLLLQRGADPNEGSSTGETALHYAVRWGRDDVVRFLIQKGADFEAESNERQTPLSIALQENPPIAELIKDSKDIIKWLQRCGLSDYMEDFIAADIFLFTLPDLKEEYLLRILPENADRAKVLSAVKRFTMEVGSFKPKLQEQQKKENFLKKLELRRKESVLRKSLNQQVLRRQSNEASDSSRPTANGAGGLGDVVTEAAGAPRLQTQDSVALLRKKKAPYQTLRIKLDKSKIAAEALRVMTEGTQVSSSIFERIASANASSFERPAGTTASAASGVAASVIASSSPKRAGSASARTSLSPASDSATNLGRSGSVSPGRLMRRSLVPSESSVASSAPAVAAALAATGNSPTHVNWEIDPLDLQYIRALGRGGSGEVWLAKYKGDDVAVKILHQTATDAEIAEFKKEFQVLISLDSSCALGHCSLLVSYLSFPLVIIKFFGAVVQSKRALVMEFCSRGSLFDVMRSPDELLTWSLFFRLTIDAAKGIADLHNRKPEILHRDVKSLNLLVTNDFHVKVRSDAPSRCLSDRCAPRFAILV